MDNNIPAQLWQPDLQVFFIKEELKGSKINLKNEEDIEAYLTSADLPRARKQRILQTITRVKKQRVDNERIASRIVKETHDNKPNEPKKILQKLK